MEYLYAVLLLHSGNKDISKESLESVIKSTGDTVDEAQISMILKSLEGKNIEEIIQSASMMPSAGAPIAQTQTEETKQEEAETDEDEEVSDEEAEHGLDSLFG